MRGFSCSTIVLIVVVVTCVDVIPITVMKKRASKTPYHTNIHVTYALLSEFTTNNTDTLRYNLGLHITLRNPNKDFGTHYDNIAVMAYYQGKKFVAENYSHIFYQEKDGTTLLKLSFKGQQDMDATIGVDKHLNSEQAKQRQCARVEDNNFGSANDNHDIVLRVYLQNTAIPKEAFKRYWKVNSQFICDLKKVPVKSASTFKTTECDSYFRQVYHAPGIRIKRLV